MNSRGIIEIEKENGYRLLSIKDSYKVIIEVEDMVDFTLLGYGDIYMYSDGEETYTGSIVIESKKDFQLKIKAKKITVTSICEILAPTPFCLNCSKFHKNSEECTFVE